MKNKKMNLYFRIGLLAGCLFGPAVAFSQDVKTFKELDAPVFMDKILEENHHLLIDVRSAEDFQKERIQGAVSAPESVVMNALLDTIDSDRPVLIYCLYGKRSKMAAQKILEKYNVKIYGLAGGLEAWKKQGYKLNKKRIRN